MFRFNLTGAEIAEKTGLTPTQISKFRKGENLRIDSVERILDALPVIVSARASRRSRLLPFWLVLWVIVSLLLLPNIKIAHWNATWYQMKWFRCQNKGKWVYFKFSMFLNVLLIVDYPN